MIGSAAMRPTLVLGGTGFLGAHVVAAAHARARELATMAEPEGPPVTGVGRDPGSAPRFTTPREGARLVAADLERPGAGRALCEEHLPGYVLSLAALSRVADCEREPERARRLNVDLPAEVAGWCAESGARLVHVSTDLVFGATPPPPGGFREEDDPGPVSVYGETKAAGERAVLAAAPDALVVRLPLLFGNSGGRGRGASDALLEAVDRGERPPLFEDELRTPLEVTAAAEALVELCEGEVRGVLHVAGPDRVSRLELGLAVLEAMGLDRERALAEVRPARRADVETLGARPADVSLDASRAAEWLAAPLPGVREGAQRAVR